MPTDPAGVGRALPDLPRPETSHSLALPDLPDQFLREEAKDAVAVAAPISFLHWRRRKSLHSKVGRAGRAIPRMADLRSGSRSGNGRAVGRAAATCVPPPQRRGECTVKPMGQADLDPAPDRKLGGDTLTAGMVRVVSRSIPTSRRQAPPTPIRAIDPARGVSIVMIMGQGLAGRGPITGGTVSPGPARHPITAWVCG